jgi:hypothetical protein
MERAAGVLKNAGTGTSPYQPSDIMNRDFAGDSDKTATLRDLLLLWGHDPSDFSIEEHLSSELADVLGLDGGMVVIRRQSNGEERYYATGGGFSWSGALAMDLGSGEFGPPAAVAAGRSMGMPASRVVSSLQDL